MAFLDRLIESETDYVKELVNGIQGGFSSSYESIRNDTLYVKIDTDIVCLARAAIAELAWFCGLLTMKSCFPPV